MLEFAELKLTQLILISSLRTIKAHFIQLHLHIPLLFTWENSFCTLIIILIHFMVHMMKNIFNLLKFSQSSWRKITQTHVDWHYLQVNLKSQPSPQLIKSPFICFSSAPSCPPLELSKSSLLHFVSSLPFRHLRLNSVS